MCLTVPAKIISIQHNKARVLLGGETREINIGALVNVKVGDWILSIAGLGIKKIPQKDAQGIIELLESQPKINTSNLSKEFQNIIANSKSRDLTKKEIEYLLKTEGAEKETLFSEANLVRKTTLRDFICIHGIIEFSNYCQNDCLYCGLRLQNQKITRYRMSVPEIVKAAEWAVNQKGYKLLVLQSGEDLFYNDEMLVQIIKKIKERCRVFIFMSVGERGYECYKKLKQAGASGVLFRFETSNPKLFKKLHPKGKNFKNRFEHLKFMRELGYFIATGSIIGLPGQTTEDLVTDILMMKKWANMVSMGPFVPTAGTSLGKSQIRNSTAPDTRLPSPMPKALAGTVAFGSVKGGRESETNSKFQIPNSKQKVELNLKMIAILRLLLPESRIPVVTALETLAGEEGRKRALLAGANSLMFNLTPAKYRPLYKIYGNKYFKKEEKWEKYGLFKYEESYQMLEERMARELEKK